MNLWQNYIRPDSITDALQVLASTPGSTCVIAGGTDLMLDLQQERHAPVHTLVDITSIPELTILELRKESLFIGAAVPLSRVASSTLVLEHAQALSEACNLIGGPQVRNMATLGGNVAHALPAADGTIALMALNAQAEIADVEKRRILPLSGLFLGPGQSALRSGQDLLVGFYVSQKTPQQGSAFKRVMRAQGIALPILNLSIWLERKVDRISQARLAVGPSGPTPRRIPSVEDALCGETLTPALLERALGILSGAVHFRSSPQRASAEYRQLLVESLLKDTLQTAWERAAT